MGRPFGCLGNPARQRDWGCAIPRALTLESILDRQRAVVAILPDVDSVKATLCGGTQEARDQVSAKLERLQAETQSAVISLMDKTGYSIAASNWNRAESFVGHDNSFREYFRSALVQPTAMDFALGTVSGKPGLDLSHDVRESEALLGVVVKVEFDSLEAAWTQSPNTTHVTNADCRVIITAEPEQRFTGPAGAARHPAHRPAGAGTLWPLQCRSPPRRSGAGRCLCRGRPALRWRC